MKNAVRVLRVAESFRGKYLRSQAKFFPISILTNFSDPLFHFPFHPTLHRFPLPSFPLTPPYCALPTLLLYILPFITPFPLLHIPSFRISLPSVIILPTNISPCYSPFYYVFPLPLSPLQYPHSLSHNSFFYHHIQ